MNSIESYLNIDELTNHPNTFNETPEYNDDNQQQEENINITPKKQKKTTSKAPKEKIEKIKQPTETKIKCDRCNKEFKENKYIEHYKTQICLAPNMRKYCSVCDIEFSNRSEHIKSSLHINNICDIKPNTIINTNNRVDIFQIDPALNDAEKEDVKTSLLIGNNIQIIQNKDKYMNELKTSINIIDDMPTRKFSVSSSEDETTNLKYENYSLANKNNIVHNEGDNNLNNNNANETNDDVYTEYENEIKDRMGDVVPEKHNKIINILNKLPLDSHTQSHYKKFSEILIKHMDLADYVGLKSSIINTDILSVIQKQEYIHIIDKFRNHLIKKINNGITTIKIKEGEVNIIDIVNNIVD